MSISNGDSKQYQSYLILEYVHGPINISSDAVVEHSDTRRHCNTAY